LRFVPFRFLYAAFGLVWFMTFPVRLEAANVPVVRLDDQLSRAIIQSSRAGSNTQAADEIVWQNFFAPSDVSWQLIRGRLGVRNGDLIVRAEGSTPVILAPKQPAVDWSLYQAVEIRMLADAGSEIKIKIGDFEGRQKLGPANQYNVYRFEVNVDAPKGSRLLGIMPTDSLHGTVAIHSIKLIPKPAAFPKAAGIQELGKNDEYRRAIYVHSPAGVTFSVLVPSGGGLQFGLGVMARSEMQFRVAVNDQPVYSGELSDPNSWRDGEVDLSRWSGQSVKLRFETKAAREGDVALWANPLITSGAGHPNVVIYTVDTLRADHASVYGYARNTTPFLKQLAANSAVFSDCQAQSTWTKTSIASLLTSLYSFTHGIRADADTIPEGASTLASELRKAGYFTASIVASPFVGRATGLDRGFDQLLESPVIQRRLTPADGATDSAALNRVIFPWLAQHRGAPFFLYAHSTDPHAPYDPPAPFNSLFANPAQNAAFQRAYLGLHTNHEYGGGAVVSPEIVRRAGLDPDAFIRQAVDRYDGEIAHNDRQLAALFAELRRLNLLGNTIVIVLSDHGEEFFDHGWTAHGHTVYQELTHVVLMMSGPGIAPRRIEEPVQLIDVMPTILELAGLSSPALVEGQSLVPLLRGARFERRGLVVSSRFAAVRPEGLIPENQVDDFAIINARWKFIFRNHAAGIAVKRVELYDRVHDRVEKNDVAERHPEQVEQMMTSLRAWIDAQNKIRELVGSPGNSELDRATIQRLRSLGYLGGQQ
jgi:arylsulfatase A-like enzyme